MSLGHHQCWVARPGPSLRLRSTTPDVGLERSFPLACESCREQLLARTATMEHAVYVFLQRALGVRHLVFDMQNLTSLVQAQFRFISTR